MATNTNAPSIGAAATTTALPENAPHQRASESVVEISGLRKSYGDRVVVDNLSLRVERGEIFGILGTNGAGKTTSIECVQGMRRADAGEIRVLGCDPIADRTALRGRVGSQLQDSHLPDRLRVGEAMRLFAADAEQARIGMDDWELNDLASVPFAGLSGGQRQRLFLALALLNQPEVVFLDELTQGLDPNARRQVWGLIERVRDRGTTVVLVTHFMEEAEMLCDRVAVMTNGQLVAEGTPSQLIERFSEGVRVRFECPESLVASLDSTPMVRSVRVLGSEVEITGPSPMLAHVGAALVEASAVPPTFRVDQPDLESALLNLIDPNGVSQ